MSGVSKLTADRHQRILLDLVSKPGNDVCADCKARAPRWASHNLGIFLCMNCASIHRKIGTHITKVKSVTMDAWSREQVEVMKSIGNVTSNAKYNPNEIRHPPPANREESERDSELEKFIRWKYEFKRFMEKPSLKPPTSGVKTPATRAQSTPVASVARRPSPAPPVPTTITNQATSASSSATRPVSASAVSPVRPQLATVPTFVPSAPPTNTQPHVNRAPTNPVWDDIMSLAGPSIHSMSQSQHPGFPSQFTSSNLHATLSPANHYPSTLVESSQSRSTGLSAAPSAPASFPSQSHQQSMGNPFSMQQQPTGFNGQMTGTTFPQASMHSQSPFAQPSFAQPSQPPFIQPSPSSFQQAAQSSFSHSYTPPSSFPQQQQPQQFAPSSLPQMQMHGYQQQQAQGGNPFGSWSQQAGFSDQQQQQQQQYGQWGNM